MVEHHAIQTMQDLRIERNQMQYTNAMTNPTNIVLRIFGAVALIWAMPLTQQAQDTGSILTVGTESVSAADFQHVFLKNNRDSLITTASLDEYMELFINFKLKARGVSGTLRLKVASSQDHQNNSILVGHLKIKEGETEWVECIRAFRASSDTDDWPDELPAASA